MSSFTFAQDPSAQDPVVQNPVVEDPAVAAPGEVPDAPLKPPPEAGTIDPSLTPAPPTATAEPEPIDESLLLDGHVRQGAFLAGPGSLTFILHHSIMGGIGGLATMGIASGFRFDEVGSREAMLAGLLVGSGIGFGVSAWWQFNNWLGLPVAQFGIVNSIITAMALTGFMDLFTEDRPTLAWTALVGAELGAWLTTGLGGGEFRFRRGIAISSAAGWALAYAALFIAIIGHSSEFPPVQTTVDMLLMAPGIGALGMALAGVRFDPSTSQVMRANMFGAGVGAGVLLISALILGGFDTPTPYVLSLLGSAGAITAVSVFWVEAAERARPVPTPAGALYRNVLYRSPDKATYRNPWW